MGNLDDILKNRQMAKDESLPLVVDGICEECYWPLNYGFYDSKKKKLRIVCTQGHERTIDWDMKDG
jgi:hypothetical protein